MTARQEPSHDFEFETMPAIVYHLFRELAAEGLGWSRQNVYEHWQQDCLLNIPSADGDRRP
jgi:hypothetical protein